MGYEEMTYHTVTPPLPCPYKQRAATIRTLIEREQKEWQWLSRLQEDLHRLELEHVDIPRI